MPRNSSGVFSVLNTFTPNTVISSTQVNGNFSDAGNALTDSLDRQGRGGMLAALSFGNFRGINCADPASPQDILTLSYGNAQYARLAQPTAFTDRQFSAGGAANAGVSVQLGHSGAGYAGVGNNVLFTASNGVYNYGVADMATLMDFQGGIRLFSAPVGTAGNPIPFTQTATFSTALISLQATSITLNGVAATDFARKSASNVFTSAWVTGFTGMPIVMTSTSPGLGWSETDGAVDAKNWRQYVEAGRMVFDVFNDGNTVSAEWLRVDRTGAAVSQLSMLATNIDLIAGSAINLQTNGAVRWQVDATGQLVAGSGARILNNVGSAILPSYTFLGDDDTGMYWASANTVGIGAAGSGTVLVSPGALRLNISSSGSATGGATTPPAQVQGYLIINHNGTDIKVPFYNN